MERIARPLKRWVNRAVIDKTSIACIVAAKETALEW